MMRRRHVMGLLMAGAAVAALGFGTAFAGKPSGGGGGSTEPGVICFNYGGLAWTMNPDGTSKSALPAGVMQDVTNFPRAEPSRVLHGGHRWYLVSREIGGQTYPDGSPRRELFAVRDDAAVATQLTTQPDLQPVLARWSPGDAQVSFVGKRWVGGVPEQRGVYASAVTFDAAGNVTGLASQPAAPAVAHASVQIHDWAPDGTRIVLQDGSNALAIADPATGVTTALPTTAPASSPVWSPDGLRIAFSCTTSSASEIRTISPSGTGETTVVAASTRKDSSVSLSWPSWSPSGASLVFAKRSGGLFSGNRNDIYCVAASGGTPVNLTSDLATSSPDAATPFGWR